MSINVLTRVEDHGLCQLYDRSIVLEIELHWRRGEPIMSSLCLTEDAAKELNDILHKYRDNGEFKFQTIPGENR